METLKNVNESDQGTHSIDELSDLIEGFQIAGVRLALLEELGVWRILHGQIALDGDSVTERTWRYRKTTFLEREMPGTAVAALLRGERADFPELGLVETAGTAKTAEFQRHRSFKEWMRLKQPWPHTTWTIGVGGDGAGGLVDGPEPPRELLVGAGPNFNGFNEALASFFFGQAHDSSGGKPPRWLVQQAGRSAHLTEIIISPTDLTVQITGNQTAEASIELTTPTDHRTTRADSEGRAVFPLEKGLEPATMLMVRNTSTWTDHRYFHHPDQREDDPSVIWRRPGGEVADLIEGGEGPQVEFKREIARGEAGRKFLKTVAAFASSDGGFILFGIDDDATVAGVLTDKPIDELEVTISNMIETMFDPVPDFALTHPQVEGKTVIVLQVHPGSRNYPLNPRQPIYYKRVGATTVPVRQPELEARMRTP
ncbi:ATP-binding protein [Actinocorallia aurantiaca]|uniref:Schlafen AlbA-2 domain-containing protein n=1 Tax=Actinocorallia aurantiaca TaxID=46204 RepID=A0ABN3ULC7_9ACTN